MDKEIIKALCCWMATRYGVELEKIRIGENQKTRYGSMSRIGMKYRISVSDYPTIREAPGENKSTTNKIRILETIVHEFAHIALYHSGDTTAKHGVRFKNKLHDMLATDWDEIVKIYNFLAQDNLSNCPEIVSELADDLSFSLRAYAEARERHASNKNA